MKKNFRNKSNKNFYQLKNLKWTTKEMKINQFNSENKNQNYLKKSDSMNNLKEKPWNKGFIYENIYNYNTTKHKNGFINEIGTNEMNCYCNANKKNNMILKNNYSNKRDKNKLTEKLGTNIKISLNPFGRNSKRIQLMSHSFSTDKFFANKRINLESLDHKNYKDFNEIPKSSFYNNPDKLTKLWNDLSILKPYRKLFNIILSQLSEERKADIYNREFNELNEIKNNLQFLSASVYYRQKTLESLGYLNEKLGFSLKNVQVESKEVIIKKISKKIENLREYTVNICFLMEKIKSKIKEEQKLGKFDYDSICENYKFDKNYLIKMKEEMDILKEGYAKYFFDFGEDYDPFLLNISKQYDKECKFKDPFYHYTPLSDEMREKINQCIYMIYQELIIYKGFSMQGFGGRNISPLKKYNYNEIEKIIFKKHNEILINKNREVMKNNLWKNEKVSPCRTFREPRIALYSAKYENNKKDNFIKNLKSNHLNKNDKNANINNYNIEDNYLNDKILYNEKYKSIYNLNKIKDIKTNKEKIIVSDFNNKNIEKEENYQDINKNSQELISNSRNKNPLNIINNSENQSRAKQNSAMKNFIKEESDTEFYKYEGKNFESAEKKGKQKNTNSIKDKENTNIIPVKSRGIKIIIFNDNINNFSKDFYPYYFTSIPQEIKDMFKIENNINKNMTQGISPYLLILYEKVPLSKEIDDTNWMNIKNYILGICSFSFEYNFNSIKLNINHISNSISNNDEKNDEINLEEIKYIFNELISYIKKNFYFDEIIIEYNPFKTNKKILNFFQNDLNFSIDKENEEIEEKDIKNYNNKNEENKQIYNKMIYSNQSSKNEVCTISQESIKRYLNKNIFNIFDSVVIANNSELETSQKDNKIESYLLNDVIMKYLLDKNEKTNINRIYNKITNLDQLIKIFQNNNISKNEIPLSLAENRFDIISSILDKTAFNNCFNNSIFFNNYNQNNPSSYLDKKTGFFYNFIKPDKIITLENLKYKIKIYHILSNQIGLFFCKVTDELEKYLNKGDNIYTQLNNVYKESLQINKLDYLNDKILWIPCFDIYKHLKTFSSNEIASFHEYIKISNKIIEEVNSEPFLIKSKNNKENNLNKIVPDLNNDIFLDNDFIFGIINNIEILSDKKSDKKIESNNINNNELYIIFLGYIKKYDFIRCNI